MKRFHGIDRHLQHSTIAVLDEKGKEINFLLRCTELKEYIGTLGPEDVVIIEASSGSSYWADQVETRGAECYVIDPYKFKIIRDSWKKTDKHDARNMAKALNVSQSGILLETAHPIETKYVSLKTIYFDDNLIKLNGRVIYCRKTQSGMYQTGIKFTGSEDETSMFAVKLIKLFHHKLIVQDAA